jgi:hypothetical protein
MEASLSAGRIAARPLLLLYSLAAIMPQAPDSGKPRQAVPNHGFSAKRNGQFV